MIRRAFSPAVARTVRTMSSSPDTKFYLLQYKYAPEILEKRGPFRAEHLQLARDLKAEGKLVMAGALMDPVDSAVFVFSTNDKSVIEDFVKNDPYVKNDLVTGHSIREYAVAV